MVVVVGGGGLVVVVVGGGRVVVVVDDGGGPVGGGVVAGGGGGGSGGSSSNGNVVSVGSVVLVARLTEYLSRMALPLGTVRGGSNDSTGMPSSATDMYAFQIMAGMQPPVTRPHTGTLVMGTLPSGAPIHTAVDSCGV